MYVHNTDTETKVVVVQYIVRTNFLSSSGFQSIDRIPIRLDGVLGWREREREAEAQACCVSTGPLAPLPTRA